MGEWWLSQTPAKEFMKQSLQQNFQILWLPFSCLLKNNLHWSKDLKLRNFRYLCRSRSHKRCKFNGTCGPTFCSSCAWRSAGSYIIFGHFSVLDQTLFKWQKKSVSLVIMSKIVNVVMANFYSSDYSSPCPDAIQIKRSLLTLSFKLWGSYSEMVMWYAFYALGFRFKSHLADFGFVFFLSTFLLFFFFTFFQAYISHFRVSVRFGIR